VKSFWTFADSLVVDSSKAVVLCDHCPCGSPHCCPGVAIPDTLYLTISGDLSQCPCMGPGSFVLHRYPPGVPTAYTWTSDWFGCNDTYQGRWGVACGNQEGGVVQWFLFFVCNIAPSPVYFNPDQKADVHCGPPFSISSNVQGFIAGTEATLCCSYTGDGFPAVNFDWTVTT
jgi:hypothetical protein